MMSPERFRQVRNIFEAALEKPPIEREAFVAQASASAADASILADVVRLLDAHHRRVAFLDGGLTASSDLRTDPARMEGRHLGQYEVLREIGRGGMGTVYLARRADGAFEQQVAIKVVTPTLGAPEIIERFYQEREILAKLNHPNIAHLYDGGSTGEGWPYFVMEFVDGLPIGEWCDQRKLNVSERIRLFRTVCDAVYSAHRLRIVHRDLKPGNILVRSDGVVKLLDFGIAKVLRGSGDESTVLATRTGLRLMTPEYASPEQVRQEEITPLSDVYSLGVVLYELLTGRRPYHLKSRLLHEVMRAICETEADRPSTAVLHAGEIATRNGSTETISPARISGVREGSPVDLQRRLAGDLDGVLLKALKKEPRQRYRSVAQFAEDLDRHLGGQPVLAPAETSAGAIGRKLLRHRTALAVTAALIAALLTGGVHVSAEALLWFGGILALLGIWRILADRKLGEHFSEYGYEGALVPILIAGFLLLAANWLDIRPDQVIFWAACAITAYLIGKLIAWPFRERWAGKLLLKSSMSFTERFGTLLLTPVLYSERFLFSATIHFGIPAHITPYLIVPLALLILSSPVLMSFLEIRERGILFRGRMIPWDKIESYRWESRESPAEPISLNLSGEKRKRLTLITRKVFHFLPPTRISIPPDQVDSVSQLMEERFAPWPRA